MKTKVNICEREWCNLVFEGKNKNYGAFAIRLHSDEQKVKALFITISIAVAITIYPVLTGKNIVDIIRPVNNDPTILTRVPDVPPETVKPTVPEPPAPPRASIAFTQPVITNTGEVEEVPSQATLFASKKLIGTENIEGETDLTSLKDTRITGDGKKDEVFKAVEKMPQFPGGKEALINFLNANLRYPEISQESLIQGKVFVQFIVNKTGKITDLKIVKGLDAACDEETLRIIHLMPDWTPGIQNGHPVAVYFTLPVTFQLRSR